MLISFALRAVVLSGFALSAIAVPIPGGGGNQKKYIPLPDALPSGEQASPPIRAPVSGWSRPPNRLDLNLNEPSEWPLQGVQKPSAQQPSAQQPSTQALQHQTSKGSFIPITSKTLDDHPELKNVWVRAKPLPDGKGLADAIQFENRKGTAWIRHGHGVDANPLSVTWNPENIQVKDFSSPPKFPFAGFWVEVGSLPEEGSLLGEDPDGKSVSGHLDA